MIIVLINKSIVDYDAHIKRLYRSLTELKIAVNVNVSPLALTTVTTGSALLTNQKDTVDLTTATGSMLMNVSLPVSPGQVDGQQFTMYNTSAYYTDINTGVLTNTLDRACYACLLYTSPSPRDRG